MRWDDHGDTFNIVVRRLTNTNCTDYTNMVLRLKDSGDSGNSWSKNNKDFVVTWDEHGLHGFNEPHSIKNAIQLRIMNFEF